MNNKPLLATAFVLLFFLLSIVGTLLVYSASATPVSAAEPESFSNLWFGTWVAGAAATAVTLGAALVFSYLLKAKRRKQQHL